MPVVGLLSLELHFPEARSLKDKRAVLRSVKDRLRKLNVAVAEVDHQDLWQRASLAVAAVGTERVTVEHSLDAVMTEIERRAAGGGGQDGDRVARLNRTNAKRGRR